MDARTDRECLLVGICPECRRHPLPDGAYTEDTLRAAADDIGCSVDEFSDCCGSCFLREVAMGDVAYAQRLLGTAKLDLNPPLLPLATAALPAEGAA